MAPTSFSYTKAGHHPHSCKPPSCQCLLCLVMVHFTSAQSSSETCSWLLLSSPVTSCFPSLLSPLLPIPIPYKHCANCSHLKTCTHHQVNKENEKSLLILLSFQFFLSHNPKTTVFTVKCFPKTAFFGDYFFISRATAQVPYKPPSLLSTPLRFVILGMQHFPCIHWSWPQFPVLFW